MSPNWRRASSTSALMPRIMNVSARVVAPHLRLRNVAAPPLKPRFRKPFCQHRRPETGGGDAQEPCISIK
eukprot:11177229-Lingulodinium_polyedra.AAC.1